MSFFVRLARPYCCQKGERREGGRRTGSAQLRRVFVVTVAWQVYVCDLYHNVWYSRISNFFFLQFSGLARKKLRVESTDNYISNTAIFFQRSS